MIQYPMLRLLAAVSVAALLGACSSTEQVATEVPPPASSSNAEAEARLAAVAAERAAIEARYAAREAICYDRFFVNRCLDQAREQQRIALVAQRAIEIEAERYLRRSKVEARERAMAAAEAAYQQEEAAFAANPPPAKAPQAAPPPRTKPGASRQARNAERAQDNAPRPQDDAAVRAANVAAFEERKRKADERQQEVARRVAEREAKAARRAEAAKANGASTPPASAPAATPVQ